MKLVWSDIAYDQYLYWQVQDKKTLKRINELIKDIARNGMNSGLGKPEKLKYGSGYSRRIDDANRLVYDEGKDGEIWILACKGHYQDK